MSWRRCWPPTANHSSLLKALLVGSLYYPCSLGLTFYQQWFVKEEFHFPLFIVFCHYLLKFAIALCYRYVDARCNRRRCVLLNWRQYAMATGFTGIAASLDIGLSNWSFEYTTISLYTMGKSSALLYMLLAGIALSLESCKLSTFGVVFCISLGLFLFHFKATQVHWLGVLLVQLAALCGGIRWAASQKLMQMQEYGMSNPLDMIYHVQPWMVVGIVPLFLFFEAENLAIYSSTPAVSKASNALRLAGLIVGGGALAITMEVLEYALVFYTSSLSLGMFAVSKELATLSIAYYYKGDRMTWINAVGLALCIGGTVAHTVIRYKRAYGSLATVKRADVAYSQLGQNRPSSCSKKAAAAASQEDLLLDAISFSSDTEL